MSKVATPAQPSWRTQFRSSAAIAVPLTRHSTNPVPPMTRMLNPTPLPQIPRSSNDSSSNPKPSSPAAVSHVVRMSSECAMRAPASQCHIRRSATRAPVSSPSASKRCVGESARPYVPHPKQSPEYQDHQSHEQGQGLLDPFRRTSREPACAAPASISEPREARGTLVGFYPWALQVGRMLVCRFLPGLRGPQLIEGFSFYFCCYLWVPWLTLPGGSHSRLSKSFLGLWGLRRAR
jgi:hypothetical protein